MMEKLKFGYHTVRWGCGRVAEIFPQVLDEISTAGFESIETDDVDVAPYLNNELVFSEMLSNREIHLAGLFTFYLEHLPSSMLDLYGLYAARQIKKLMKFASTVGCEKIVLKGPVSSNAHRGVNEKECVKLSKVLTRIGKECRKLQMRASYHPVRGSIGVTIEQIEKLLEMVDPELLNLTLATGHLSAAGLDPLEIIKAFGDRIDHVHLEDMKAGAFVELGEGTDIDILGVIKSLRSIGYAGWVIVEDAVVNNTDPPTRLFGRSKRLPIETARNSKRYIENLMKSI
jgi:inosose dehydratase